MITANDGGDESHCYMQAVIMSRDDGLKSDSGGICVMERHTEPRKAAFIQSNIPHRPELSRRVTIEVVGIKERRKFGILRGKTFHSRPDCKRFNRGLDLAASCQSACKKGPLSASLSTGCPSVS